MYLILYTKNIPKKSFFFTYDNNKHTFHRLFEIKSKDCGGRDIIYFIIS